MNRKILALVFLVLSLKLFGQEKSNISILETESTWNQEVFNFPIPFAPEIKFEGLEDARFPEFWANKDNIDFWSYVFVWSINNPVEINSSVLENNIELYFNGLMNYKNSMVLFLKSETSKNITTYVGKIKTFDNLITKSSITLNVKAQYHYCHNNKKTFVVFRFSPKNFESAIWNKLNKVSLRNDFCDL